MKRRSKDKQDGLQIEGAAKRQFLKTQGTSENQSGQLKEQELLFQELLGEPLKQWDEMTDPAVPSVQALAGMARQHRSGLRKKLWRDLVLLWIVGGFVLSGLLILVQQDIRLFVIVQVVVFAAAVLFLIGERVHRGGRGKWTN